MKDLPVEVIDCHIHPPVAGMDSSWFAPSPSPQAFGEALKDCGISRCAGTVIAGKKAPKKWATHPGFALIEECNRAAFEFQALFPDFYIPGIHIHPHFPQESCHEIERWHRTGKLAWIGELVGYSMGHQDEYLVSGSEPIYDLAAALGIPVNIHCGTAAEIDRLAGAFPRLKLVLAHPQDKLDVLAERLRLVATHRNLHLDISGTGLARWGLLRHALDICGAEKILFGSDAPINNPAMYVHGVLAEKLSDNELAAVFAGNFKRLTGIA